MNIDEIRRANLQILVTEVGGVSKLAKLIEKNQSQVSQWIRGLQNSGTGRPRGMRAESCRYIERKCGKAEGWLDTIHNTRLVEHDEVVIWPFKDLSYQKICALSQHDLGKLEASVLIAANNLNLKVSNSDPE